MVADASTGPPSPPTVPPAREPSPADQGGRLDLFKTLGDNTRYAIYLELARSPRPLTTADIADTLALHTNTVRPHLERMREVGLVEVEAAGRGEIGRPQHRYALTPDAPSLGLEPPVMPVLARMVLSMAERLGAGAPDAVAVGADEGARRAGPFRRAPSTLEAVVSELDRLGFDPAVTDAAAGVGDLGDVVVAFANCPFGDLAGDHPELVCNLHRGLVAGFVAEMGDTEVREFCSVIDRDPCQVRLGERP